MDVSKEWRDSMFGVDVGDNCSVDKRGRGVRVDMFWRVKVFKRRR